VQPVLGLIPDARAVAVEDVRGDLLADVRGEAVERNGVRPRERQLLGIETVRLEVCGRRSCSASWPMLVQTSV